MVVVVWLVVGGLSVGFIVGIESFEAAFKTFWFATVGSVVALVVRCLLFALVALLVFWVPSIPYRENQYKGDKHQPLPV